MHFSGAQGGVAGAIQVRAGADIVFGISVLANASVSQFFSFGAPWTLPDGADLVVNRTAAFGSLRGAVGYNYVVVAGG